MKLDEIMPVYSYNEVHRTTVKAAPERTIQAARALKAEELSLFVGWMLYIRQIPAILAGNAGPVHQTQGTFLDSILSGGRIIDLGSLEDEILFGMIGQFWKLTGGADAPIQNVDDFLAFSDPAYARVAANIAVRPAGEGTLLSTETRIWTPDETTRKKFAKYWFVISAGSGWIRSLWLAAIKHKAEGENRSVDQAGK